MMITTASVPIWILEQCPVLHKHQTGPQCPVQYGFHHSFCSILYQKKTAAHKEQPFNGYINPFILLQTLSFWYYRRPYARLFDTHPKPILATVG